MSEFQHFTAHLHFAFLWNLLFIEFSIVKEPFYSSHHHAVGPLLGSR